ncbi:hypothetical protein C8J56DRAFT_784961 [Mycena floridula]|nr:hypothetical protein C8J56DRAFT_784961 [Mycena floridula]
MDVIFRSSDGHSFGGHRANMERFSDGFPHGASVNSPEQDIVHLSERGEILALLLRFMHAQRPPVLDHAPLNTVIDLADAAEKYFVFSVMEICRIHISKAAKFGAASLRVLYYATRHDYTELMEEIAPLTVEIKLKDAVSICGTDSQFFMAWVGRKLQPYSVMY